jgi:site-specific recombinase XerD
MKSKEKKIPILMRLMYGEKAELAQQGGSGQLIRWCQAFEEWLGERKRNYTKKVWQTSLHAWEEILEQTQKTPWEIKEGDIREYREWLQERTYAAVTIRKRLTSLDSFYDWCSRHKVDNKVNNPVLGVRKPKDAEYGKAQTLSVAEAQDFLEEVLRDGSILSKRDYAFFLARLLMGAPLDYLLKLKFGQIERHESGRWVRWERGRIKQSDLPEAVWEAIDDYLDASGRAERMGAEEYIFAPLVDPLRIEASGKAEDWDGERALTKPTMLSYLKRFGRRAGIPEAKLNMATLRHTATMLRVEAGDDSRQIQGFLHRPSLHDTSVYIAALVDRPAPQADEGREAGEVVEESRQVAIIDRRPHHGRPWIGMKHGFYARSQPPEEVAAIITEGIVGLEEELVGMRALNRMVLEMGEQTRSAHEAAWLAELTGRTASHIGKMLVAKKQLAQIDNHVLNWVKEFEEMVGLVAAEEGLEIDGNDGLNEEDRTPGQLSEAIASTRLVLRRTLVLIEATREVKEVIQYAKVYCRGCHQLVNLLSYEAQLGSDREAEIKAVIDQTIREVSEEMGLSL